MKQGPTTGSGDACAKTILLGEHFVVFGAAAIALPVHGLRMRIELEAIAGDSHDAAALAPDLRESAKRALERAIHLLNGSSTTYRMRVESTIPVGCGAGSSAAFSVGLLRALARTTGVLLTPDTLNEHAYHLERGFHGTPSGIDNTVVSLEKPVWFRPGEPVRPLHPERPLNWVLVDSGQRGSTALAVEQVREWREAHPSEFDTMKKASARDTGRAEEALVSGDAKTVGDVMKHAHSRLVSLGLSTSGIQDICDHLGRAGAQGAKLTGSGLGGCVLGVFEDAATAESAMGSAREKGREAWVFSTGGRA